MKDKLTAQKRIADLVTRFEEHIYQISNPVINPTTEIIPKSLPADAQNVMVFASLLRQITYNEIISVCLPGLAKTAPVVDITSTNCKNLLPL